MASAVGVAVSLDIAERLRKGPLSAGELARRCGVQEKPLEQVLRALAGFGVFERNPGGRYALNRGAEPLLRDSGSPVPAYALLWAEQLYALGGRLLEQVRSGTPAFELEYGAPIWSRYRDHPAEGAAFGTFMSAATRFHAETILEAWDLGRYGQVVDVGAHQGVLLAAILARHPTVRGVWFDREEQLSAGRERLEREVRSGRCALVTGSFLERVPSGGDLYVLKHVLHDWPDAQATTILRNVARAMSPAASLLIVEGVLDADDPVSRPCLIRDLEQMAWTGGALRTRGEIEALLGTAGLGLRGVRRTRIPDVSLVHAGPVTGA
jgi:hypothetical protein